MFEIMDSEKAYILGFIAADGCNSIRTIEIQLQKRDIKILQDIQKVFKKYKYNSTLTPESRKILCTDGWRYYSRLRIYSTALCTEIKQLGIIPNKSKNIRLTPIINTFFWDYARGYFDGNGHIGIRRNSIEIEFYSGSPVFLNQLNHKISALTNLSQKKVSKKQKSHSFRLPYYAKEAYIILNNIYQNSGIKLNRKFQIFSNFNKSYHKKYWTPEQVNTLKIEINKGNDIKSLVLILNRSYKSVSKKLWELKNNKNHLMNSWS